MLILAPYAVWVAVSVDVVVAVLGAAMVAMGVRASARGRTGWRAGGWALACGVTLGLAALFSYAAPWLGLSVVCLYFARRRAFLNVATGLGALLPVLGGAVGRLQLARRAAGWPGPTTRPGSSRTARRGGGARSAWWCWCWPPARRWSAARAGSATRPGWPFLVGAGVAVAFSVLAGLARGGAEAAWLPFFPWLTVAAVAPDRAGRRAAAAARCCWSPSAR